MKIICEECGSAYKIKDELIAGKESIKTQCPKCKFIQKNDLTGKQVGNPFKDKNDIDDFINSVKAKDSDFEDPLPEKYRPIENLPDIDLKSLEKEEIKEKISGKNLSEDSGISNISNIKKEKSEENLYSVKKGSSFLGPYTLQELEKEIIKGHISKDFLFSKNGDDWKKVEEYREILPFFKNKQPKSNALKYLVIGVILIVIAFITVKLLDKYTNNDYKFVYGNSKGKHKKTLFKTYIENWKKKIILTKTSDSLIYTDAIENFYKDMGSKYIKAANQFKEVLVKNPERYDAFYYLVLTVSFSDVEIEKKQALKDYLNILKSIKNKQKQNELYYNALSAISLKLENYVDSFNYAKESVSVVSNNALANYLLAKFYFKSQKINDTVKYLKLAIKNDERLVIAKKLLAKTFISGELYKEAIAYYEKNDTVFSKYMLAKVYLGLGYYDKAFNILKKLSKSPQNKYSEFNILYAVLLYQYKNNRTLALNILKRLEKKVLFKFSKSDKVKILNNIAIIYRLKGKLSLSIKYSNKVFDFEPDNKIAKFNLALIRIRQRKFKEAEILIKQYDTGLVSTDKYDYILKLELYLAKKDYNRAIEYVRKLINFESYNNIYYVYSAYIYSKMNNLNMIQDILLKLSMIDPDYYLNNYFKLKELYVKNIEVKELITYLESKLKDKDTDKALILNNIGILHYQMGNFKNCAFYMHKSISIQPRNPSSYLYLAYVYYHQKKYSQLVNIAQSGISFGNLEYLYLIYVKGLLKQKRFKEADEILKKAVYYFKYSKVVKLMQALINLEKDKDAVFKKIISEIKNDFKNDLSFRKLMYSQTY